MVVHRNLKNNDATVYTFTEYKFKNEIYEFYY